LRRQRHEEATQSDEILAPANPERSASRAAEILALQQTAGNAAVSRWLSRSLARTVDYDKARAERDTFIQAGKKGPVTYNPSARNPKNYYGGFDVSYDPAAQALQIIVKGAIKYLPGMAMKSGLAEAKEPSPQAAVAADEINALPSASRADEVKKWQWSKDGGPDADDEKTFLAEFKSTVESTWQGKHAFHCSKRYWEDLGAETAIDIQIADGEQGAADHMKVNAYKVPPTMNIVKADVTRTNAAKGAFGNTLTLNSSTVRPKGFNLLLWDIGFDPGTNNLTTDAKTTLTTLGGEVPNAPADATVPASDLTAKVPGADDAARQARFTAVRDALTAAGVSSGRVKFEAAKAGFKGVQHARSDGIMGSGTNVRPHHYVTFLDALKVVTKIDDWEYGKAHIVWDPSKIGDFPLGGPGGTAPTTPPDTVLA
jgi:hypothetical protein